MSCAHDDRRKVARGLCNSCYVKDWYARHPDVKPVHARKWRSEHPGEAYARLKERLLANPVMAEQERIRTNERARIRREAQRVRQGRRCLVCLTEFATARTTGRTAQVYCSTSCRTKKRVDNGHRPIARAVRARVLERDAWRCYLCGYAIDPALKWPSGHSATVDHVIPRGRGGSDDESNLRATHWNCNEAKHDSLPTEIGVHVAA